MADVARSTTREDLLRKLEELVASATMQSATHAATTLKDDGIYGFWLMREYFGMFSTSVFTEADLNKAVERYPDEGREALRWAVSWPWTRHFEDEELQLVVDALQKQIRGAPDAEMDALLHHVDILCLRTLRRLREAAVLDASVVFALGAVEQSEEETYVYAEQLCDAATLAAFRRDLPRLREADVAIYRQHLARL